jgi:hypothetical protein
MGMGMGMGMGLGMSMMDMAASGSGRAGMALPPHVGASHNGNIPLTSLSRVDMHDPRLHNPNVMDPIHAYLARQHQPLQIPQALNMDMYNAYMLQHQHLQHQQQHQQATNMGGGPTQ